MRIVTLDHEMNMLRQGGVARKVWGTTYLSDRGQSFKSRCAHMVYKLALKYTPYLGVSLGFGVPYFNTFFLKEPL